MSADRVSLGEVTWPALTASHMLSILASETPTPTAGSVGSDKPEFILFGQTRGLVYEMGGPSSAIDLSFTPANNANVTSLTWFVDSDNNLQPVEHAAASNTTGAIYLAPQDGTPQRTAKCSLAYFVDHHRHDLGKAMVVGIDWTTENQTGRTYSPAFSVVEAGASDAARTEAQSKINASSFLDAQESRGNDASGQPPPAPSGGSSSANPPLSTGGSSSSNGTSNVPTVSSSSPHRGGGGGGLSTGAIAGIAVGVVVAALLAAALCFFFFFWRRRRRGGHKTTAAAAREDQTRAEQEKLSSFPAQDNGRALNASDAAIAPYRDERHGNAPQHRVATGEEGNKPLPLPPHGPESGSHAETAQGGAGGVGVSRHLVEDGMTPAEIRRLEEEEAHLDSEIQRAGGGRR